MNDSDLRIIWERHGWVILSDTFNKEILPILREVAEKSREESECHHPAWKGWAKEGPCVHPNHFGYRDPQAYKK